MIKFINRARRKTVFYFYVYTDSDITKLLSFDQYYRDSESFDKIYFSELCDLVVFAVL